MATRSFFALASIIAIAVPLGLLGARAGDRMRAEEVAIADIPPDASNVVDLGNHWRTFTLETRDRDGRPRISQFLHHYIINRHASGQAIAETIVELRD